MSRFPKGLLLIAILAELMILTVASRTEIFPFAAEQPARNVMIVTPALPNASVSGTRVHATVMQKAKTQPAGDVVVVEFKTPPQHVI